MSWGQSARKPATRALGMTCALMILLAGPASCPVQAQGKGKAAATVNSDTITEAELFERLQKLHGQDFVTPTNPPQFRPETAGQIVLGRLIDERLILQAATKANLMPSEAEMKTLWDEYKKQPNVTQALASHTETEDSLKNSIRLNRAMFALATNGVKVTPEEVEVYYKAHIDNYTIQERWDISAIRTLKFENVPKIEGDLKLGKSFEKLVEMYSDDDRSKNFRGALGTFAANDPNLPGAFRDAIKQLKVGDVTPVLKLDLDAGQGKPKQPSWWFLQLTRKEEGGPRPFADVKSQVERLALLDKAGGLPSLDKKILDLRREAQIKINLPGYDALLAAMKKP
jgi:hypothetical protein